MTKSKILLLGAGSVANKLAIWLSRHGDDVIRWPLTKVADMSLEPLFPNGSLGSIDVVIDVLTQSPHRQLVITQIEQLVASEIAIFTSALDICATQVASWLTYPERVVGFQPWLPDEMGIMEVCKPLQAEQNTQWDGYLEFWNQRGKEVELVDDVPGLVFPRVLATIINKASFALTEGVATVEDIDLAMKYGTNYPYGPFEWADLIGINEILTVLSGLQHELGDDRYRPAAILRKMVYAGRTGRAEERGFYLYS